MDSKKVSFEESLGKKVVESGRCVGCGTCVVACPFNCLELAKEEARLIKECKVCGICAQTCPQYEWLWPEMENSVFGKERKTEEDFGIYRRLVVAQANDARIKEKRQDGGVVTALLLFALENGLIDGAVVAGANEDKPFYPAPKLATNSEEILNSAETKYSYSPNILALTEVVKQKKTNVAFVGTPCQIRAIRKMQMAGLKKFSTTLKFLIGLMCSESFTYDGLMEKHIHERLGVNLKDIKKINIKGKMLVTTASDIVTIPLQEIKQYARKNCSVCDDFSSELADVSVGGLGLDGWSFVVVRTEKGEELFCAAEKAGIIKTRKAEEEPNALNLLHKLSQKKKKATSLTQAAKV
jgi:coenzyme F420 hydrogenase subunit beta